MIKWMEQRVTFQNSQCLATQTTKTSDVAPVTGEESVEMGRLSTADSR